jgi:hypothetical protein
LATTRARAVMTTQSCYGNYVHNTVAWLGGSAGGTACHEPTEPFVRAHVWDIRVYIHTTAHTHCTLTCTQYLMLDTCAPLRGIPTDAPNLLCLPVAVKTPFRAEARRPAPRSSRLSGAGLLLCIHCSALGARTPLVAAVVRMRAFRAMARANIAVALASATLKQQPFWPTRTVSVS